MKKNQNSICIIGLGFVGLTLSIILAKKGFVVHGVEKNKEILSSLRKKKSYFFEPQINNKLKKIIRDKKFFYHNKIPNINNVNTYIITVGTPLNSNGKLITKYIDAAVLEIAKFVKNDDCIILRSTVKVGTTRKIVKKLNKITNKKIKFAFCPERAIEGAALKELNYLPQIIGGYDSKSVKHAKSIFSKVTKKIVQVSSLENAEMIKLIDNSSRDVFFAYANEIARCCDEKGLDANEIISSGKKYYKRTFLALPGLVGGPCLHKDPYIFSESFKDRNVRTEITLMARKINERQPGEIVNFIDKKIKKIKNFPKKFDISILGLAFKGRPITDDLRGSMSLKVFEELKKKFLGSKFYGYDPIVDYDKIKKKKITPVKNIIAAFKKKNLVVITNNHIQFSQMNIEKLASNMNSPGIIYDFWNHFSKKKMKLPQNIKYISLGRHFLFK